MNILIDMNLSPDWSATLHGGGHTAVHWSKLGDPRADDRQIMQWARENIYIVFTHDLDFGAILASTNSAGPSVIQIRGQNILASTMGQTVLKALRQFESELLRGALVTIADDRLRVRVLPLFHES